MASFEILPGLPPYGPPPEPFPSNRAGFHRQGLVVAFSPEQGERWVGNFQRGLTRCDTVVFERGNARIIVVAGGEAYVINPETRKCEGTFGSAIQEVVALEDGTLVFSNGLRLEARDEAGLRWRTRRLSLDGIRSLSLEAEQIRGEARNLDDEWVPFAVSLASGEAEGGSNSSGFE